MSKKNEKIIRSGVAEFLTYVVSIDEKNSIEMRYEDETIWFTQKMMTSLYDVSVSVIHQYLKQIFDDGELVEGSVCKKYVITDVDGKNYQTNHYNLQAILAVGFKVKNERAVQFRKWIGQTMKDYIIQGWIMDKERLKKGTLFSDEYFEHQLENICEIRLSKRNIYQKITDLYATAFDYDKDSKTTRLFFKAVQNKMVADALIAERVNAEKELSFYLDYAELQAKRHIPMSMEDWTKRLDDFCEIFTK